MSGKDKNRKSDPSEFLRYSGNKMSNVERNAFEKELQKDSFTEEAAEGFTGISSDEAGKDIALLQKRLKTRTAYRQRFVYFRIAASVAVLMVISSVFIIIERNKPAKQISVSARPKETLEISESKDVRAPSGKKSDLSIARQAGKKNAEQPVSDEREKYAPSKTKNPTTKTEIKVAERDIMANEIAAPVNVLTREEAAARIQIKGKVLSSEDNMPIPGANVTIKGTGKGVVTDTEGNFNITLSDDLNRTLVVNFIGMETKEIQAKADSELQVRLDPSISALSEVVVVGYGVSNANREKEDIFPGYAPPQPEIGKSNFGRYIQNNLHRPDSTTEGQRVVVVVSFMVRSNGSLDSIKIIRSPAKLFSNEAVRLIKEGPAWKPAVENGTNIDDEVRIRIVFK